MLTVCGVEVDRDGLERGAGEEPLVGGYTALGLMRLYCFEMPAIESVGSTRDRHGVKATRVRLWTW